MAKPEQLIELLGHIRYSTRLPRNVRIIGGSRACHYMAARLWGGLCHCATAVVVIIKPEFRPTKKAEPIDADRQRIIDRLESRSSKDPIACKSAA